MIRVYSIAGVLAAGVLLHLIDAPKIDSTPTPGRHRAVHTALIVAFVLTSLGLIFLWNV